MKKKISIITIHHIHNFGSVFQAWALCQHLTDKGYDTKLIDYQPEYYKRGRNRIKTYIGRMLNYSAYKNRKIKFDNFIKKYDVLSDQTYRTLQELSKTADEKGIIYLAGGDQLWNDYHPCGKDGVYKFSYVQSGRKIAFGTSIGRNNYTNDELETLSEAVSDFEAIMLRESSTVDLLQKHTNIPVEHVIDPVGLISIDRFREMAVKPNLTEPYAVMYLANSSPLLDAAIEILSNKMNLKIVHICGFKKKCNCDYFLKDSGPEEILGYIMNAQFVLSASFHATMFALLFNIPFASILPGKNTNARIEDLLKFVGLEDRIICNESDVCKINEAVDFKNSNRKLMLLKKTSEELLINAIEENN